MQFTLLSPAHQALLHVLLTGMKGVENTGVNPYGIVGMKTSGAPNRMVARARATVVVQRAIRELKLEGKVEQGPDSDGYMLFTISTLDAFIRPSDLWFQSGYDSFN